MLPRQDPDFRQNPLFALVAIFSLGISLRKLQKVYASVLFCRLNECFFFAFLFRKKISLFMEPFENFAVKLR